MINPIFLAGGLAAAVVGVAFLLIGGELRAETRRAAVGRLARKTAPSPAQADKAARRKQIVDGLRDLERASRRRQVTLQSRIEQAGLSVTPAQFVVGSLIAGLAIGAVAWVKSGSLISSRAPRGCLAARSCRDWRWRGCAIAGSRQFIADFPNAIDIIVRGVRAGLPLGDTHPRRGQRSRGAGARANSAGSCKRPPSGSPLPEAVERMARRVPVAETNFFAIVIEIQGQAGGNLSEALANLSRVLRERKKMKAKIGAMAMEAKASAAIIGAVPFLVVGALYVPSPKYVSTALDDAARPADRRRRARLDGHRRRDDEENGHLSTSEQERPIMMRMASAALLADPRIRPRCCCVLAARRGGSARLDRAMAQAGPARRAGSRRWRRARAHPRAGAREAGGTPSNGRRCACRPSDSSSNWSNGSTSMSWLGTDTAKATAGHGGLPRRRGRKRLSRLPSRRADRASSSSP